MRVFLPPRTERALLTVEAHLGEAYLVGGAVRDLVLGREPEDLDFATPLPPEEVARRLEGAGLPVGLQGARFGTVYTALLIGEEFLDVEITTFRRETQTVEK